MIVDANIKNIKSENIEIWYSFCPSVTASNIALSKGWLHEEFKKFGAAFSHISTLPVKDWQAHQTHRHPRLLRDGGNIPPIWAKSEGAKTKVVAFTWIPRRHAVLVNKNSKIFSIKNLKGKKVVLLRRLLNLIDFPRATEKRAVLMSLKTHGMSEKDIRFVDMPIEIGSVSTDKTIAITPKGDIKPSTGWKVPQEPAFKALINGNIDAIWACGGQELILERTGLLRIIYDSNNSNETENRVNIDYPYICTVNSDFAEQYPEIIIKWMEVIEKAGSWAKSHYEKSVKILAKATHIPEDVFKASFPIDFNKRLCPDVSKEGVRAIELMQKFLKENGFINNEFNVEEWIDCSYLEAAKKDVSN